MFWMITFTCTSTRTVEVTNEPSWLTGRKGIKSNVYNTPVPLHIIHPQPGSTAEQNTQTAMGEAPHTHITVNPCLLGGAGP